MILRKAREFLFGLLFILICSLPVGCKLSAEYNKAIKSKDVNVQYSLAEKLFAQQHYSKAQVLYENIIPYFKNERNYGNILFNYAKCFFYLQDYETAVAVFQSILQNLPNFTQKEQAYLNMVVSYHKQSEAYYYTQDNTTKAIGEAQQFMSLFPKSNYRDSCINIIESARAQMEKKAFSNAKLYYDMANYLASKICFQAIVLDFPDTKQRDMHEYYKILSAEKVLELTVEQKRAERQIELINYCVNFEEDYPSSDYTNKVKQIHASTRRQVKKEQSIN